MDIISEACHESWPGQE